MVSIKTKYIILIWIIVLLGNKNITGIQSDEDEADEVDENVELMNKLKAAGLEKAVRK